MPCESPYTDADHARELKRELDTATRLLCGVMQSIQGDHYPMLRSFLYAKVAGLQKWWEAHQRADQERQRREAEERERAELKAQALAKLTPEERQLLRL